MDKGFFNNGIHMPVQLQKVNEPVNWQHYRIQAAIAAMQGMLANETHSTSVAVIAKEDGKNNTEVMAEAAVQLADALIEELQKKQD